MTTKISETQIAMLRLAEAVEKYGVCSAETKSVVAELQEQFTVEREIAQLKILKDRYIDAEHRLRNQAYSAGYEIDEQKVDKWYAKEILAGYGTADYDVTKLVEKRDLDLILELIAKLEK